MGSLGSERRWYQRRQYQGEDSYSDVEYRRHGERSERDRQLLNEFRRHYNMAQSRRSSNAGETLRRRTYKGDSQFESYRSRYEVPVGSTMNLQSCITVAVIESVERRQRDGIVGEIGPK